MKTNFCFLISICSFLLVDELKGLRIRKKIKIVPKTETIKAEPLRRIPNEEDDGRKAKFLNPFSLFNVVQFPNTECTTASGQMGTCFTASECAAKGGEADGGCASGFGTCCSFSTTCDTTTGQNGTYFSSPATIPSVCSLMITPLNDNICQVKIIFIIMFSLAFCECYRSELILKHYLFWIQMQKDFVKLNMFRYNSSKNQRHFSMKYCRLPGE